MRFLFILLLTAFMTVPVSVMSKEQKMGGGFIGPQSGAMEITADQVKNQPDGARVSLVGSIVSQVSGTKDKYVFKDSTGETQIEIDRKRFRGQNITPANTARIYGKIDKDFGENAEVDVKQLEIIK